jgi:hypothetical protein
MSMLRSGTDLGEVRGEQSGLSTDITYIYALIYLIQCLENRKGLCRSGPPISLERNLRVPKITHGEELSSTVR